MLLMYAKFIRFQNARIPDLVRVQQMTEQGKTPFRQVGTVFPKLFYQFLVEVMMVDEDVLEKCFHEANL